MAVIYVNSSPQLGTHDSVDSIFGTGYRDIIYGGYGIADPNDNRDVIYGYGGDDQISANAGNDIVDAGGGADIVWGGGGNDEIYGGEGNDSLFGSEGADTVRGGYGDDVIYGGRGEVDPTDWADRIYGGAGKDRIYANGGDDVIEGGPSADSIWGGSGKDTYVFCEYWSSYWTNYTQYPTVTRDSDNASPDQIYGFERGDKIDLRGIDGNTLDRYDHYGNSNSGPLATGNDRNDSLIIGQTLKWYVSKNDTVVYSSTGFAFIIDNFKDGLSLVDFIL